MSARGSYAKGVAKRQEILRVALEVFAQHGFQKTSLRELAERVELSQAGVLHYFGSKEELFTEVLRMRDTVDRAAYLSSGSDGSHIRALADIMRHNAEVPGLVGLYATMSTTAATDPEHPAHDFFQERYRALRQELAESFQAQQAAGALPEGLDPERLATILIAVADGLQVQWMLDPSLEMSSHVEYLWSLLAPAAEAG